MYVKYREDRDFVALNEKLSGSGVIESPSTCERYIYHVSLTIWHVFIVFLYVAFACLSTISRPLAGS